MYARPFYRADSFDGTRKLAFQRPLIIHLFAELADTKLFLIEQFETDRAAFGQTLLRQAQAQFVNFICRNFNSAAGFAEAVRNIHLRQLADNCATILIGKIAE